MKVGILGGGQLGRMLALAGYPLGFTFRTFDPSPDAPTATLTEFVRGGFDDQESLRSFAQGLDLITFEFENVPLSALDVLAGAGAEIWPPRLALETGQDRLREKELFRSLGIPCAEWRLVDSAQDLEAGMLALGAPCILKHRRLGYDGKGQVRISALAQSTEALQLLGTRDLILEQVVPFQHEFSLIAVSGQERAPVFYPLVENIHRDGILRRSRAPSPLVDQGLQLEAEKIGHLILQHFNYRGVLTIEFFLCEGQLLANEIAPRVHNSGHWTIEGAHTSQFENHLRAIAALPLGSGAVRGHSIMRNLIGGMPPPGELLKCPGAHLHLYGKGARPGRKIGHVTLQGDYPGAIERWAAQLEPVISGFEAG